MLASLSDQISAVLFDAGGTLLHVDYRLFVDAASARGYTADQAAIQMAEAAVRVEIDRRADVSGAATGDDASRLTRYFRALLATSDMPPAVVDEIAAEIEIEHRRENLWRTPMPGAAEVLRSLRQRGLRTAVVSNADGRAEAGLKRAGLADHLELVVDSHLEGVEKPDPEIFRRALRRLDVSAQRAAYIGDIYSIDAVGAKAAGMWPVIIDPTGTYKNLDCPIIADLRELLRASTDE